MYERQYFILKTNLFCKTLRDGER